MQAESHCAYWLVKSEPFKYPFQQLMAEGRTLWDGVRNFEARNNLRAMQQGDYALYYHSNEGKAIVGVARICQEAYPDPTASAQEDWSVVDLEPVGWLTQPVTLAQVKGEPQLSHMALVRRSRLSVAPVSEEEFMHVLRMGETAWPLQKGSAR